jgi:hypothetical protein
MQLIEVIKLLADNQQIEISATTGDEFNGTVNELLSADDNKCLYQMRVIWMYSSVNEYHDDYIHITTEWMEGDKNEEQQTE